MIVPDGAGVSRQPGERVSSNGFHQEKDLYVHKENDDGSHRWESRFFPRPPGEDRARRDDASARDSAGMDCVVLGPEESKHGAVETHEEAKRCAALFQKNRERIDGVIVALPNFGDERAIADTLRLARLDVPVLVQATPDTPGKDDHCFATRQLLRKNVGLQQPPAVRHSLLADPALHTVSPDSTDFQKDLAWFAAVCRIVNGLRNLRVGSIGARPAAFNTVRYSEKLLEAQGISVETIDLSEIIGTDRAAQRYRSCRRGKLAEIRKYVTTGGVPDSALIKMAKLGAVIDGWMKAADVTVSAVQCWTAMEEFFGVVPCTIMSMMSNNLIPSACEVDVCGTISMHALALASETPSALLDWNNNYGDDPNKAVCFHCSNLPKHFFQDVRMDFQEIIAGTVGKENTFGTCVGRVKAGRDEFCALLHRRHGRRRARLYRRGRVHQRSAQHVRRGRSRRNSAPAASSALHLRKRLRASRGRKFFHRCSRDPRSHHPLSRLADVPARPAGREN